MLKKIINVSSISSLSILLSLSIGSNVAIAGADDEAITVSEYSVIQTTSKSKMPDKKQMKQDFKKIDDLAPNLFEVLIGIVEIDPQNQHDLDSVATLRHHLQYFVGLYYYSASPFINPLQKAIVKLTGLLDGRGSQLTLDKDRKWPNIRSFQDMVEQYDDEVTRQMGPNLRSKMLAASPEFKSFIDNYSKPTIKTIQQSDRDLAEFTYIYTKALALSDTLLAPISDPQELQLAGLTLQGLTFYSDRTYAKDLVVERLTADIQTKKKCTSSLEEK